MNKLKLKLSEEQLEIRLRALKIQVADVENALVQRESNDALWEEWDRRWSALIEEIGDITAELELRRSKQISTYKVRRTLSQRTTVKAFSLEEALELAKISNGWQWEDDPDSIEVWAEEE